MQVLKFDGTSICRSGRMYSVVDIITKDSESKIVVLSALSRTTNALVSIGESLAADDKSGGKRKFRISGLITKHSFLDYLVLRRKEMRLRRLSMSTLSSSASP